MVASEEKLKQMALLALRKYEKCAHKMDRSGRDEYQCRFFSKDEAAAQQHGLMRVQWSTEATKALDMSQSLQFDALCLALQRNDAATTKLLDANKYPKGYALRLGEALQNNTRVSTIDVHVERLVPESFDAQQALAAMRPLLHYFRTSKVLRSCSIILGFFESNVNKLLMEEILKAFFETRKEIDALTLGDYVPVALFCKGMRSTALKTLDIRVDSLYSPVDLRAIKRMFRSNATLESLRIDAHFGEVAAATAILEGLAGADNCKLCELKLMCDVGKGWTRAYCGSLSKFLRGSTSLKHLLIEEVSRGGDMGAFLRCLEGQTSISKLMFQCWLQPEAMSKFIRFMSARKQPGALGLPSLCELVLNCDNSDTDSWSAPLFVSMLCAESSIGSQIRSLTLHPVYYGGADFLEALGRNAHHTQLTHLSMSCLDVEDCWNLARYLSKTQSLQVLEVQLDDLTEDVTTILWGLRANGSLRSVTNPGDYESACASTFFLRNVLLGPMLQNLTEAELDQDVNMESTRDSVVGKRSPDSLVPSLLQAAKQVSATRTSVVLSSLLGLADSVGPTDVKMSRKRNAFP
jgi:hypothetical protein